MKISMRAAVAVSALLGGLAWAGEKHYYPVMVALDGRYFNATMSMARNSDRPLESFHCFTETTATEVYGACSARDAAGVAAICYTYNQNLLAAIRSITDSSLVQVQWDASGMCTYIQVRYSSAYEPKK
ncbi:hypothetical protein HUW62_04590 [Myxococcus sp. AM011]|uniref:hypothetical protein n=1 Tax=Myxococcus sp. AM011 TaxID=2745200 RepID=UPI001594F651|nr:hypothetical protein [Myxococcus sp. AM011]NVJ20500.1 hypothetical protein [Myxococcus sp. AM011]